MIRILLVFGLLAAATASASATPLLGDFECVSDHGGADTYHGTLRIEEPTSFGFLNAGAAIDAWYPLSIADPANVLFDNAFAERISAGAVVLDAQMVEDEYAYRANVRTRKGDVVSVYCLFIY